MWTYEQSTGKLYSPDGLHVATGYAGGNGGANPAGVNNHAMQDERNIGPLPVGAYVMDGVVSESHLGPMVIPLVYERSNQMFGRNGFYIHGDRSSPARSASEGCIILPRAVREEMIASTDKQLVVIYIKGGL